MKSACTKIFIAGTFTCAALYAGFVVVQSQFQYKNISFEGGVDLIKELYQDEFQEEVDLPQLLELIFQNPLSYLDRGRQSYAFLSGDGKYVVKFFDTGCLRSDLLPHVWRTPRSVCTRKMSLLLSGYGLAYRLDRDHTGLIFLQLVPHPKLIGKVITVSDRFGLEHAIDLTNVPFVVQHKAIPTRVVITKLLDTGDVEGAKAHLKAIVDMYLDEYRRGLYDRDHNFMYNTGFIDDKPIRIDVGRLRANEKMKEPEFYMKDLAIIRRRTDEWLGRHFPAYRSQITDFMDEQLIQASH